MVAGTKTGFAESGTAGPEGTHHPVSDKPGYVKPVHDGSGYVKSGDPEHDLRRPGYSGIYLMTFIRESFYEAVESKSMTRVLIDFFENKMSKEVLSGHPLLSAYYGAAMTLNAKHGRNPFSRLSNLRSGLQKLDDAAETTPGDFEIRFLRFSVLHHLPSFLGFGEQLSNDTQAVFEMLVDEEYYQQIDAEMAGNVMEFIIESGRLNETQQSNIIQRYEKLKADESIPAD